VRVTIVLAALTALGMAGCTTPSRALSEEFDTTRTVSLSGRVATLLVQHSQHTYVLIDVQISAGRAERWAVRSRPSAEREWTPTDPPFKPGDLVTVVAYPAKPGADVNATIPAEYPRLAEVTKAGRLVYGIQLTLVDGNTIAF
jgi:hypothetical protein